MYVNMTRPVTADIRKLERARERRKSVQRNELDAQLCGVLGNDGMGDVEGGFSHSCFNSTGSGRNERGTEP